MNNLKNSSKSKNQIIRKKNGKLKMEGFYTIKDTFYYSEAKTEDAIIIRSTRISKANHGTKVKMDGRSFREGSFEILLMKYDLLGKSFVFDRVNDTYFGIRQE